MKLSDFPHAAQRINGWVLAAVLASFLMGWLFGGSFEKTEAVADRRTCLREEGYELISPLLGCDQLSDERSPQQEALQQELGTIIEQAKKDQKIDSLSLYYRDLKAGEAMGMNLEEKYFPASLGKLPVMLAMYKMAEGHPDFLQKQVKTLAKDMNESVAIAPEKALAPDSTTSIEQALGYSIKYSDNNAFYALVSQLDNNQFNSLVSTLKIPVVESPDASADYVTPKDLAYVFRVLYSATYLDTLYSQAALQLLTAATYKNGIVSGVPADIKVAHKFGVFTYRHNDQLVQRQLHDCGIVYAKDNPYLLCVMTKSRGELAQAESVIQEISKVLYEKGF